MGDLSVKVTGAAFNVCIPETPNFVRVYTRNVRIAGDEHEIALPIEALTDEALQEIGRAWTADLVKKAHDRRMS